MTILAVKELHKHYHMGSVTVHALRGVDAEVIPGEFIAIMGPSGSGKSTFLHLIGGLDKPSSGEVIINGTALASLTDDEIAIMRRRQVGFVFQFFNLLPTLNAAENIALPLLIDGQSLHHHQSRIMDLLDLVGLADRADHYPDQLSGGQQQRVAIARALVTNPAVLLADEPTGNLDSRTGDAILELMRRTCDEHRQTILMVTHSSHAAGFADRVIYLKDGMIAREIQRKGDRRRRTETLNAIMVDLES